MKLYLTLLETMFQKRKLYRRERISKEMEERIKTIIYFSILSLFILLLSLTIVSFYFISQPSAPPVIEFFVRYHVFFMFSLTLFALLFGSLSHILLRARRDKEREEMRTTIDTLLTLLSKEESLIISYLMKNKSSCTQYELTKLEGMTKLKVHRALERLESKRVISREKLGKINKVYLSEELSFR